MQTLKAIVIGAVMILILSGCAAGGKQSVPFPDQAKRLDDPSKARIYVMRLTSTLARPSSKVSDGGKLIGNLGSWTYISWEREPGQTKITTQCRKFSYELPLVTQSGQVYYIQEQVRIDEGGRTRLKLLDEGYGRKKLADCKPAKLE